MVEDSIRDQVLARLKELLFDESTEHYKAHEMFYSKSNHSYQFLVWKIRPTHWDEFSNEVRRLVEQEGYECIPGACDVSTYNPDMGTGYKVIALYNKKNG